MTTYEQIPPFLAEMPEPARASYLSPEIAPKLLPCELTRVMPWHDELLPADLREYVRDVAERTQCPPDFIGVALVVAVSAVVENLPSTRNSTMIGWSFLTSGVSSSGGHLR